MHQGEAIFELNALNNACLKYRKEKVNSQSDRE